MSDWGWAATPEHVAMLMVDRLAPASGKFTEATTPTRAQVQDLLDLLGWQVLAEVGGRDITIPESLWGLARLAHAKLVAAHAENQFGEQTEQTSRAVFLNIAAKDSLALLTEQVKAFWARVDGNGGG